MSSPHAGQSAAPPRSTVPGPAAGPDSDQSAAPLHSHRARARGRDGLPRHHPPGRGRSAPALQPAQAASRLASPRLSLTACRPVGRPATPTSRPGPAAGLTRPGPLTTPPDGQTSASIPYRRGSQPSRRTPTLRQVWGTDPDTSWRRRIRRALPAPGPTDYGVPGTRRLRFAGIPARAPGLTFA